MIGVGRWGPQTGRPEGLAGGSNCKAGGKAVRAKASVCVKTVARMPGVCRGWMKPSEEDETGLEG